jgi:glycosyltransferase involved in cell wall biosynthesis
VNVWLVNQYALPPSQSGGTRHYSLAHALASRGIHLEIFASTRNYLTGLPVGAPGPAQWDGVAFTLLEPGAGSAVGRRSGRLAGMLGFRRAFRRAVAGRRDDPVVIVGSSPSPIGAWGASVEARRRRVPFVLEVRDLWPKTLVEVGGYPRWHPAVLLFAALERALYRRAAHVVTLLPRAEAHIVAVRGGLVPVTWIPNGVDLRLVRTRPGPAARPDLAERAFVVMYAGAHGPANALDAVLDTAAVLERGRPGRFRFVLVGDGHDKPRLRRRAEREGLQSVTFLDPVPKAEVYDLLAGADVLIVNMNPGMLYRAGISFNKLYDYLAVGRPIVSGSDAADDPVAAADAGLTVPANDAEALAAGLERVAGLSPAERAAMGARGRAFVQEHHDIDRLAERYAAVLRSVAAGGPSVRVSP